MKKSVELKMLRNEKIEELDAINQIAETQRRDLSSVENDKVDQLVSQVKDLNSKIEEAEASELRALENATITAAERKANGITSTEQMHRAFDTGSYNPNMIGLGGKKALPENVFQRNEPVQTARGKKEEFRNVTIADLVRYKITGETRNAEEKRAVEAGTDSKGGFLVPESISNAYVNSIRAKTQIVNAGAVTSMHDQGSFSSVNFAQVTTPPVAGWYAEGGTIADSTMVFGNIPMAFHNLIAKVPVTAEFLQDAIGGSQVLNDELSRAIAQQIDYAAFYGLALNNQPVGLDTLPNVQQIDAISTSPVANYSHLVNGITKLKEANYYTDKTAAILSPTLWGQYANLTSSVDAQPLLKPEAIRDLPLFDSSMIKTDIDVSGNDTTQVYLGNWENLIIGVRSGLKFKLFDHTDEDNSYTLACFMRVGIACVRPDSFVKIHSVKLA